MHSHACTVDLLTSDDDLSSVPDDDDFLLSGDDRMDWESHCDNGVNSFLGLPTEVFPLC
jgi:hypothetical protein